MTKKKNNNITKSEALILSWKNRSDYKGYDRSKGSLFNTWRSIVYNRKGKDIGFPEEWKDYNIFCLETKNGWCKGKVLIRKNSSIPYSKDNYVWEDKGTENVGRLSILVYNKESKTILEWCKIFNLNYNGVRQRYHKGKNYTPEQILFGKLIGSKKEIKDFLELSNQQQRNKASKMLSSYKHKDKKRGLDTTIKIEELLEFMSRPCFYCGDTLKIGLDRIDNTKGHIQGNVVSCCYECNTARSNNFTVDEMKIIGNSIKLIKLQRNENNKN